jgi:hypothetical protein
MRTLNEIVMGSLIYTQNKHELGEGWAEERLNKMDRLEYLERISDALEELFERHEEAILKKASEK